MRTYKCLCNAKLFFGNTRCATCGVAVGWCDECRQMAALAESGTCANPGCGAPLAPCANRVGFGVCNCFVLSETDAKQALCRSCRRTTVIPNTAVEQDVHRWGVMEAAKRRLFYDLDLLGISDELLDRDPPLSFRFMADSPTEHVTTGHADGVITINLEEADPVQREAVRQQFGEPQRTIIGHLRHEFAHFLWLRLVQGVGEEEFKAAFGNPADPPYAEAMQLYYEQGPSADWPAQFISQYAASHAWEDFAETAAFYLDMRSVLDTLNWQLTALAPAKSDFDSLLQTYLRDGILLNEINRTLGLIDVVPEVVNDVVAGKLRYVHELLLNRAGTTKAAYKAMTQAAGSGTTAAAEANVVSPPQ